MDKNCLQEVGNLQFACCRPDRQRPEKTAAMIKRP
jgi:hypothetical protein